MIPGLVSVIIPTYNRSHLVQHAIQSVVAQTWKTLEIIVVDDGSTDDTAQTLSQRSDVLFLQQQHKGRAAARNLGLKHARGQYLCALDSDDIWHPNFLSTCIAAIEKYKVDFAFANWIAIDEHGYERSSYFEKEHQRWNFVPAEEPNWYLMNPEQTRRMFLESCACPSSGLVFSSEIVCHGWTSGLEIADDWCLLRDIVLSRPSRVAFTLDRSWQKHVVGNNIYDMRDDVEELLFSDSWFMFKRHFHTLTRHERAEWSWDLCKNSVYAMRDGWRKLDLRTAIGNLYAALAAAAVACTHQPIRIIVRMNRWLSRKKLRLINSVSNQENLPGTMREKLPQ